MPVFRDNCPPKRTGEKRLLRINAVTVRTLLWEADGQSGFTNSVRRMQCDHKPMTWRRGVTFQHVQTCSLLPEARSVATPNGNILAFQFANNARISRLSPHEPDCREPTAQQRKAIISRAHHHLLDWSACRAAWLGATGGGTSPFSISHRIRL